MAIDNINEGALNTLNNVQPKGNDMSVSDFNYVPQDLSPEQQAAYKNQYRPTMDPLAQNAYYPDLGHNINVGNYFGSEIGSTTLFAPGGGLVPLGLMDARDAAIQKAALQKAKDEEDFKKQFQAPTTKHTVVQKNLTDKYFNGLQQWNQNALKKAGGNQAVANKMLQNDPNFQQWNKSMQDVAKFHDSIVEHGAELMNAEKDPNFVMSPETRKSWQDVQSGVAYLDKDPFSKEGRAMGEKFLGTRALYDLDKSVNTAIDKAIPTIEQLKPEDMKALGIDPFSQRGKVELANFVEKEYFTPEQKKNIAQTIYNEKYKGTDIPYDAVEKKVNAMLGEKIKRNVQHYDKWFKPDATPGDQSDYANAKPVSETTFNVNVKSGGKNAVSEIFSAKSYKTSAADEGKEISVPISKNTIDTRGEKLHEKSGHVTGSVSEVFQGFYDNQHKRWLTPDEVKDLKEGKMRVSNSIVAKPAVMFNIKKEAGSKGPQNSLILDVNEIKGKFPKKGKEKKSFDDVITELEQEADTENSKRKGTGWPVNKEVTSKTTTSSGQSSKPKIAGF